MATYNLFELAAMSAPEDNWGYRARAEREGRAYDAFASDEELDQDDAEEAAIPVAEPMCPARFALWRTVSLAPIGELAGIVNALKSHIAECAECGSGRKIVQTDRELLDANAVCCEGKAA